MAKAVFFDLDGTLTDSGEGIINCVSYTLGEFGLPIPSREALRVFVGPPLRESFVKFGVPADRADEAVKVYRSRYIPVGIYENFPYPGIEEVLKNLKEQGHRLFVATSKPEWMAVKVLEKFELAHYFERICGAAMDGVRDQKSAVIAYLLEQVGGVDEAIMIGDTKFDVIGANAHSIPTIGVSWGYGTVEEMEAAGAKAIAHTMDDLFRLINE